MGPEKVYRPPSLGMGAYTPFWPLYSVLNTLMQVCSSLNIYQSGAFEVGYKILLMISTVYCQLLLVYFPFALCYLQDGLQAIHCAAAYGEVEIIHLLIQKYGVPVTAELTVNVLTYICYSMLWR